MDRPHFPADFETRMRLLLGSEYDSFLGAHNQPSPTSIRLNPLKRCTMPPLPKVPWTEEGRYLNTRPVFTMDPLFHAGAYYVQEASSMFLEQLFRQVAGDQPLRVLDVSAAPGGKSTHILSLLPMDSLLVSNEVIRSRAPVLYENIQKWGYPNCIVTNNDPSDFSSLEGFFDVIVVDAPCSGEGLFRKDPGSVSEWSSRNIDICSARQRRILQDVWPSLKENGVLIYSTCTYNDHENEENLLQFSQANRCDFIEVRNINGAWNVLATGRGPVRGYRFYPHRVKGEGFFISALRKTEQPARRQVPAKRPRFEPLPRKMRGEIENWLADPVPFELYGRQDLAFGVPARVAADMNSLPSGLRIVHAGINIADVRGGKLVPHHALALSPIVDKSRFPVASLDLHSALRYLRREPPDHAIDQKGFALVSFADICLGWMNVLGTRTNNLYPLDWRIRMEIREPWSLSETSH